MERKKYLIVTAGGTGSRMGSSTPKQFITIGGKVILRATIEKFLRAVPDIKVITVLPKSHISWWRRYCIENNFVCPQVFVEGGITRFHSVGNALDKVPDGVVVAVHDAVRPFVSVDGIRRLFAAAESSPAVVPVMPCTDTLKPLRRALDGSDRLELIPGATADRSSIFEAQTPQIFYSEILKEAYNTHYDIRYTDDASVLEIRNASLPEDKRTPLSYVAGERFNFKITTQDDLRFARVLARI